MLFELLETHSGSRHISSFFFSPSVLYLNYESSLFQFQITQSNFFFFSNLKQLFCSWNLITWHMSTYTVKVFSMRTLYLNLFVLTMMIKIIFTLIPSIMLLSYHIGIVLYFFSFWKSHRKKIWIKATKTCKYPLHKKKRNLELRRSYLLLLNFRKTNRKFFTSFREKKIYGARKVISELSITHEKCFFSPLCGALFHSLSCSLVLYKYLHQHLLFTC